MACELRATSTTILRSVGSSTGTVKRTSRPSPMLAIATSPGEMLLGTVISNNSMIKWAAFSEEDAAKSSLPLQHSPLVGASSSTFGPIVPSSARTEVSTFVFQVGAQKTTPPGADGNRSAASGGSEAVCAAVAAVPPDRSSSSVLPAPSPLALVWPRSDSVATCGSCTRRRRGSLEDSPDATSTANRACPARTAARALSGGGKLSAPSALGSGGKTGGLCCSRMWSGCPDAAA
eukprot:scaffold88403_cov28-Tisochrysis_lutea.AAC.4